MKITMYDVGFGDCFLLDNDNSHLLVDFGINKKAVTFNLNTKYSDILTDLATNTHDDQRSFLLTHYHDDHFSGLDYMINTPTVPQLRFNNIYIPNVWNANDCVEIVALLMLSCLRKGLSLFKFLTSILSLHGTIYLISAGDNIETDYTALWPNIPLLQDRAQELIDNNHLDDDAKQRLLGFSAALITEFANCNPNNKDESIQRIKQIEKDFATALDTDNFKRYIKDFSTRNLNSFGNEVSIVFHNQNDLTDQNILFTGDAGDGCSSTNGKNYVFDTLANNRDLYPYYKAIKLPHHGTPSYFSFELCNRLAINAPYLLMSNGSLKKTFLNHLPTIAYYDYCKLKITNAMIIRSDDFGTLLKRTINI